MSNAKIIDLDQFKNSKESKKSHSEYQQYIDSLDKLELLNEMVSFNETRSEAGELTDELISKGLVLFRRLEWEAESEGLKSLAGSYRRHLEHEMADRIENPNKVRSSDFDFDEEF